MEENRDYHAYRYGDYLTPGSELKIEHSVVCENVDISTLITMGTDSLEAMRQGSIDGEQKAYELVVAAAKQWEQQAAATQTINRALEYLRTPEIEHTGNQWKDTDNWRAAVGVQRSNTMSNIVIVGSGPAGVSAALYAVRAGVQTTVLTKGSGALARAEKIENYYGFAQPVSGPELERRSIENARRLGVQFVQTEAVGLTWTDRLTVETLAGAYPADAVILATGASRAVPRIPGLTGLEGHGVSWCAACDAFFYRGKDVAVLGSGEYALHEVQALLPVVKSVTLLTNGAALTADFPPEVSVCTQKVEAILGEQTVTGVQLADGAVREVSGVFVALGVAGSTALARKLGAAVEGSRIVVDDKMQTTVPGLYAAGDCTGGLLQVAKAVYEGALAGTEAAKALRKG